MKTKLVLITLLGLFTYSCDLVDKIKPEEKLAGTQSVQGEVGNSFSAGGVAGIGITEAKVTNLADGVSSIKIKLNLTDSKLKTWGDAFPYSHTASGNNVEFEIKGRMTDEGIQTVFPDGNLTLVKYDGKVGDTYTAKIDGKIIKREIVYKSTTDDYSYSFFNIKVMQVEETGLGLPGLSKVIYSTNHKFGLVGIKGVFEDGTEKNLYVISSK